jgi:hypothetical protein
MDRISGLSFDTSIGNLDMHVDKFSLDITDDTAVAFKNGRPDGSLRGKVSASGSITMDRAEMKKLTAAARAAGSFQNLPPFDINSFAQAGEEELKVEAFGCKLKLGKILDIDKESSDKTTFDVPFDVTDSDFVKIDGVPYIEAEGDRGSSISVEINL